MQLLHGIIIIKTWLCYDFLKDSIFREMAESSPYANFLFASINLGEIIAPWACQLGIADWDRARALVTSRDSSVARFAIAVSMP